MSSPACPSCWSARGRVVNSRQASDAIRRRRECHECGHRWNTLEVSERVLTRAGIDATDLEGKPRHEHSN